MELSSEVKAAVAAKVGESILASLDGPERDAILAKAITDFLGGYELKGLITAAMNARALKLATAVIESGAYDQQIMAAINEGLGAVLERLPNAVRLGFTEMLVGKNDGSGYSQRPGLILPHLRG